jgi:anti-anti-sigma factor
LSLSIDSRHCGAVYILRCAGRIVAGEEITVLETSIDRGLRESSRVVLEAGEVSRVDSTGMGLLVRFLTHTRNRGGDFRLAALPPFLDHLLQITKLSSIFHIYGSEEDAIVSFLKQASAPKQDNAVTGPKVLFVDQSADLCAFVRGLLGNHGYEVLSTCRLHDARMLLSAAKVDYIVLGPNCAQVPSDTVAASLKPLAPSARTVQLQSDFKYADAERAGQELLQRIQGNA